MTKRKSMFIICGVALVGGIGVLMLISKGQRPLASLSYLGALPQPKSEIRRFSISNTTDSPITFNVIGVESYSNQVWKLDTSSDGTDTILPPHQTDIVEFVPPSGAKRWRGWLNVGQEKKGVASLPSRVEWFWGQARTGFRNGVRWPTGEIVAGGVVITEEITE
jgi:hypothetical protein